MGSEEGRKRLCGDELDSVLETLLQKVGQCEEAIVALLAWDELDENVYIAVGSSLIPQHRTEERKPANTECPDFGLDSQEALHGLIPCQSRRAHADNVRWAGPRSKDAPPNDLAFSGEPAALELCRCPKT